MVMILLDLCKDLRVRKHWSIRMKKRTRLQVSDKIILN